MLNFPSLNDSHDLHKPGTKPELREHIKEYLDEGELEYKDLVDFLDTVVPWGKQHVFLYNGSGKLIEKWRSDKYVNKLVEDNNLSDYLNARLPLILPEKLTLSSVQYTRGQELLIYTVERREHWQRSQDYDESRKQEDLEIEMRAYIHQVIRGIVIFRWNLVSNYATLQISQLPSDSQYEEVEERFANLIHKWLDLNQFQKQ